jgi:hypothetical protein
VYASEIYAALQRLPLVDYVANVTLAAPDAVDNPTLALPAQFERVLSEREQSIGIALAGHELPAVELSGLLAVDYRGNVYRLEGDQAIKVDAHGGGG